jgi:hypothetical protein
MGIVNRRNAVLGWGVWKIGKYAVRQKAKDATPGVEDGRPNKPMLAVVLAGLAGAVTFWRRRRSGESV